VRPLCTVKPSLAWAPDPLAATTHDSTSYARRRVTEVGNAVVMVGTDQIQRAGVGGSRIGLPVAGKRWSRTAQRLQTVLKSLTYA